MNPRNSQSIKAMLCVTMLAFFLCMSSCKKAKPGPNEVFMENSAFTPSTITVSTGTKITWTNQESTIHTVTSDNSLFDSGDLAKKKSFSFTFSSVGTFKYHCIHHSGMTGTVIVQ